jgi:hypothetical protein
MSRKDTLFLDRFVKQAHLLTHLKRGHLGMDAVTNSSFGDAAILLAILRFYLSRMGALAKREAAALPVVVDNERPRRAV